MATRGRKKRKRKSGARTGVGVHPHTRTPRGPNSAGGKRKPVVRVDGYQRGKPSKARTSNVARKRRKKKKH